MAVKKAVNDQASTKLIPIFVWNKRVSAIEDVVLSETAIKKGGPVAPRGRQKGGAIRITGQSGGGLCYGKTSVCNTRAAVSSCCNDCRNVSAVKDNILVAVVCCCAE